MHIIKQIAHVKIQQNKSFENRFFNERREKCANRSTENELKHRTAFWVVERSRNTLDFCATAKAKAARGLLLFVAMTKSKRHFNNIPDYMINNERLIGKRIILYIELTLNSKLVIALLTYNILYQYFIAC